MHVHARWHFSTTSFFSNVPFRDQKLKEYNALRDQMKANKRALRVAKGEEIEQQLKEEAAADLLSPLELRRRRFQKRKRGAVRESDVYLLSFPIKRLLYSTCFSLCSTFCDFFFLFALSVLCVFVIICSVTSCMSDTTGGCCCCCCC